MVRGGTRCLRLHSDDGEGLIAATIVVPAAGLAGKLLRVRTWLRTDDVMRAATPWVRADDEQAVAITYDPPAHGTIDEWTESVVEIEVPSARTVSFGVALLGAGTAWFDDVRVEVIAPPPAVTLTLGGRVTNVGGQPVPDATVALMRAAGVATRATVPMAAMRSGRRQGAMPCPHARPMPRRRFANYLPTAQYNADASRLDLVLGEGAGVAVGGRVAGTCPTTAM